MLRMLQLELAYPSEFQFTDNFRFELRLARSSSHSDNSIHWQGVESKALCYDDIGSL